MRYNWLETALEKPIRPTVKKFSAISYRLIYHVTDLIWFVHHRAGRQLADHRTGLHGLLVDDRATASWLAPLGLNWWLCAWSAKLQGWSVIGPIRGLISDWPIARQVFVGSVQGYSLTGSLQGWPLTGQLQISSWICTSQVSSLARYTVIPDRAITGLVSD